MREEPRHRMTTTGTIKLVALIIIISIFIGLALYKRPIDVTGQGLDINDKETRGALVKSLDSGNNELIDSKSILIKSGIYDEISTDESPLPRVQALDAETIMCPQYKLPLLPELPELPPKEVMDTVSKDQLNFILYQHIKQHQERTIEVRRHIYVSYSDYLKSCE